MKQIFTPNDYLHLETDSKMIQAAVDEAAKVGATVEIPRYNERTKSYIWELDESIILYTGSQVVLDNCHIRLGDFKYINFFRNSASLTWRTEVNRKDREFDISLVGRGNAVLDGGTPLDICEADFNIFDENGNFVKVVHPKGLPSMWENIGIRFVNVERIRVEGLRFINTRYWTMAFWYCSHGVVRDISIKADNNVPNQDGVNIRLGSHNFLIENIDGYTGDDTIALTGLDCQRFGKSDMNEDIHHVIVRNIRSYQTGECDIVRILPRGGTQIYNVLLDGIMDVSEPGNGIRPLAAIRIGDICDYPIRLNKLGEVRNLTIRNVSVRARFGAYIANSLADSVFDNIQLYDGSGIGMYFNGCELKNVTIRDLCYDSFCVAPKTDIGYEEIFHRVKIDELNAVHFNNCTAENLAFDGVRSGKGLSHVFGGNSPIDISAEKVVIADKDTKLTCCANIKIK